MDEKSAARVILPVNASKILAIHVRVDLRGRDVSMPKHFLDRTQIRTTLEQMRREGVAKRVWRDVLLDPCARDVLLEDLPRPHACERLATRVEEQDAAAVTLLE